MARQQFGQHFLASTPILQRIANAACGQHAGTVIEIGPGRGALTEQLLRRADRVIAFEIDPALAALLRERYATEPRFTVIEGDALQQDFAAYQPDVVCGNLPYYVATPLLARMARSRLPGVALIQKEVAERITAKPGSRDYGFLTCEIGLFAEAEYLFSVKPGAFRPPPKVNSGVIRLVPNNRLAELDVDEAGFLRFVSECFHLKRKTLRNNLVGSYSREVLDAIPETNLRGEQCSLRDLAALYRSLMKP